MFLLNIRRANESHANEWVEKRGKSVIRLATGCDRSSSSVIFTDIIRTDLLIFIFKKKKKFPIPEFRCITGQANLAFDSKLHIRIKWRLG